MVADETNMQTPKTLLGLRSPDEFADRSASGQSTSATNNGRVLPERPTIQIVSSGYNSEDDTGRGKSSDLLSAIGAGVVLVIILAGIGLLLG